MCGLAGMWARARAGAGGDGERSHSDVKFARLRHFLVPRARARRRVRVRRTTVNRSYRAFPQGFFDPIYVLYLHSSNFLDRIRDLLPPQILILYFHPILDPGTLPCRLSERPMIAIGQLTAIANVTFQIVIIILIDGRPCCSLAREKYY